MSDVFLPEDHSAWPPAPRVLAGILRMALPDVWRNVLEGGLTASGRLALPQEPAELMLFVRKYVAPRVSLVRPNRVLTVLDELEVQLGPAGTWDPPPAAEPELDPPIAPRSATPTALRITNLRRSLAKVAESTSARRRAPRPTGAPPAEPDRDSRPLVLIVARDRLERSYFARTLVGAKFDVTALDSVEDLLSAMNANARPVAAVLGVGESLDAGILRTLAAAHPDLPILCWTRFPTAIAQRFLALAGFRFHTVAPEEASAAQLLAAVRDLLAAKARALPRVDDRCTAP